MVKRQLLKMGSLWTVCMLARSHIRGLRPNCEAEWANPDPKHHRLPHIRVPWDKVWESLGNPISDATEERHWRKLLHRGTFVRNTYTEKGGSPAIDEVQLI